MTSRPLTDLQRRLLRFVRDHYRFAGTSPSISAVARKLNRPRQNVDSMMHALAHRGYLTWTTPGPNKPAVIVLTGKETPK